MDYVSLNSSEQFTPKPGEPFYIVGKADTVRSIQVLMPRTFETEEKALEYGDEILAEVQRLIWTPYNKVQVYLAQPVAEREIEHRRFPNEPR